MYPVKKLLIKLWEQPQQQKSKWGYYCSFGQICGHSKGKCAHN